MAGYRNSIVNRSASDSSACSLALQESFKRKCHGSPTRVTVTNGEIASVLSRHDSFDRDTSTLERLRSFTANEPEFPPYLYTKSFDGKSFSEEVPETSFDHYSCDDWVRTDMRLDKTVENHSNKEVYSESCKKHHHRPGINENAHSALKTTKQQQKHSRDPFNGLHSTYFNMESANLNTDQTWKAQREAFWSVKQELASTLDFDKILPELLKFNFFTNEQLRLYSNFQPNESSHASKGINENKILHAVSERVDTERSAMPMLMLSLRKHQPTVADMLQHKIFSIKSQRDFHQSGSNRMSYSVSTMDNIQKLDSDLMYAGCKSSSTNKHAEISDKFPPITSRYSRRPMAVHSSRDYDHTERFRKKHHPGDHSSSPYFSKTSLANSILGKVEPLPNKFSPTPKARTSETTVLQTRSKSPKRKYVKFQEKVLGKGIAIKQTIEDREIKTKNCQEIKDTERSLLKNERPMNHDMVSPSVKVPQEKDSLMNLQKDDLSNLSKLESAVKPVKENIETFKFEEESKISEERSPNIVNKHIAQEVITQNPATEVNTSEKVAEESDPVNTPVIKGSRSKDTAVESTESWQNTEPKTDPVLLEETLPKSENLTPLACKPPLSIKNEVIIESVTMPSTKSQPLNTSEKINVNRPPPPLPSKHERPKTHSSKGPASKTPCKSTLYIPTSSKPSPDVVIKRTSSCRLTKSSRPTIDKGPTHAIEGKLLGLELSGLENVARPRSQSLDVESEHSQHLGTKSEEEIAEKLSILNKRYRNLVRHCMDSDVIAFDITSLSTKIDELISELTKECVISTRSAWMLRKMPAPSARVSGFVDILIGLNDHDANDVISRCTMTSRMLKTVCAESGDNSEKEKEPVKLEDKPRKSPTKTSTLTTTLISPSANKPRFPSIDYCQKTDNDLPEENLTKVEDKPISKLTSNETPSRCEAKMKEMDDKNGDIDNISKNTPNDTKICFVCQNPGKLLRDQEKEKAQEKGARERTAPVTSSIIVADLVQVKPIDATTTDTEPSICSDTESAVSASSDTDSLSSLGRSRRQYSRLSLNSRRTSARKRLERSNSHQQGSYISKVLFPISTRKNSLRKTKSSEGAESKKRQNEASGKDIQENKEPKIVEDNTEDKMPPVLPLTTSKHAENRLNEELLIEETVTQSDLFQFKVQCDKDLNIDDVINDENNNDVMPATPEKKSAGLTTILTNGSRSPPSSLKKKINHRVSFSDLPPIEMDLDDNTTSDVRLTSTPDKENQNDLPKIDLTKIDGSQSVRKDSPMPKDLTPKKTNHKSHRHDSRDKEMSPSNEIDEINELLMDILEEIEAENISLDQCLDDLVTKHLLSNELACTVSSTYVQNKNKSIFFEGSFLAESPREEQLSDTERERAVEKLLDVLTNLGLETLRKCRNCILGRLCQLSTYEDFETAQKAAVAASESNSSVGSSDDNDSSPSQEKSTKKSESSHSTPTDCEIDGVMRHRIQYYDVTNTSLTVKEDRDKDEVLEITKIKSAPSKKPSKIPKVSSLIPILIDEEIIEAKATWVILGAGKEEKQRTKLRETLKNINQDQMDKVCETPGLEGLLELLKSDNSDLQIRPRPRSAPCLERTSSLDLNQVSHTKKESRDVFGGRVTRTMSERHPEGSTRLFYRSSGIGFGANSPGKENEEHNLAEENAIDTWCRSHNLTKQSAIVLKIRGYNEPAHLYDITEDDLEQLDGLTWLEKAKIWLAIENSRLTDDLKRSKRQGITDIYKII